MEDWPDVMKPGLGEQGGHSRRSVRPGTRPGRVSGPADGPKIRGIDPELEGKVTNIRDFIIVGSFDLDGDKVILGSELARTLGANVGDKINIFSPGNINEILQELDRVEKEGDKTSASALKQMILPMEFDRLGNF